MKKYIERSQLEIDLKRAEDNIKYLSGIHAQTLKMISSDQLSGYSKSHLTKDAILINAKIANWQFEAQKIQAAIRDLDQLNIFDSER